jgi:(1->4)-alpha-D-glucan 1-alpha-D-glucosylmutase
MGELLRKQRFLLTQWPEASQVINYRRFFDVSSLICLSCRDYTMSMFGHTLVFELVARDMITGLRIDHIDGLWNPELYLRQLRKNVGETYIVAEKILVAGEQVRWWSVEGTTGYDFLNVLNGIFVDVRKREAFDTVYSEFTGCEDDPRDLICEKKKLVMNTNLKAEVDNLARWLEEALEDTSWREVVERLPSREELREGLVETLANLSVYRTYLSQTNQSWHDGIPIAEAIARAEARNPHLLDVLRLLAAVLMAAPRMTGREGARIGHLDFAMTLQQYTGAVMAKGFEDTFLYVYNRLVSLNEVGGDPAKFGVRVGDFHAFNLARSSSYPHSMNATSTHDTKRGEDVRARINVLSEIPYEWAAKVSLWAELNAAKKTGRNGEEIPDRNDEYFLYQTLVGSYPFDSEELDTYRFRLSRYVRKAAREAKRHTRWRDPDATYEDGFAGFAENILEPSGENGFLESFVDFQGRVAHYGAINSLSQTLIKICAPGVPDFYQGAELWDLNLVDPDNRRPVDYGLRVRMLEELAQGLADRGPGIFAECLASIGDGRAKMLLMQRALAARKANSYLFQKGSYRELKTSGKLAEHVVAFARHELGQHAVCIVPRFVTGVVGEGVFPLGPVVWGDTAVLLPPGSPRRWRCAISGVLVTAVGAIPVGEALMHFPVSLLMEDSK